MHEYRYKLVFSQAGSCCVVLHLGLGLKCRRGRAVVATSLSYIICEYTV